MTHRLQAFTDTVQPQTPPAVCGSYGRRESSHPAVLRIHFWCCYCRFAAPVAALSAIRNMVWPGLGDDHETSCWDHGDPRGTTLAGWIPSSFGIEHTNHSTGYVNWLLAWELIFICNFILTKEKTCRTVENVMSMWLRTADKKVW
jgi:hypothetical protein